MKQLKSLLALLCITTASLLLSMPAHALQAGDTIYLMASGDTIRSASIKFSNAGTPVEEFYPPANSTIYSATIPDGATEVSFEGIYSPEGTFNVTTTIPSDERNTYDLTSGDWITPSSDTPEGGTVGAGAQAANKQQISANPGSATINVKGKLGATPEAPEEIVSVDVTWGAMEFTYTPADPGTWDPENHRYTDTADASWSASGNDITVTNHSNVGVTATFDFEMDEDLAIKGKFSNTSNEEITSVSLDSAEGKDVEAAPSATVYFQVESGEIQEDTDSLGTIAVTIAKKE
jgi:hypothetical protein